MSRQTQAYKTHLRSKEWQQKKIRLIRLRGNKCEGCGATNVELQLHHKNYDRLGSERDTDLLLVCATCHPIVDRQRVASTQHENAQATYARKKYGDRYVDSHRLSEEFDRWLDKKREWENY